MSSDQGETKRARHGLSRSPVRTFQRDQPCRHTDLGRCQAYLEEKGPYSAQALSCAASGTQLLYAPTETTPFARTTLGNQAFHQAFHHTVSTE